MMRSLYTASTGMYAQQMNIDTLAHNMSNVNTTGFKKQRIEFQDLLYQQIKRPTVTDDFTQPNQPQGLMVGLGVKPSTTSTMFSQGNFLPTDNPLDVAINGQAFFKLEIPDREDYVFTRDGSFKIDAEGQLVNADGYLVVGADPLEEGAYDVKIEKNGTLSYLLPGDPDSQNAGQIELVKFANPMGLLQLGGNLFQETPNSGEYIDWEPENDPTISLESGFLEASNVQVVEEMVNLISAQRAYEFNSKIIQSSDEMLQAASNLRR
ncbi:MAG: flagellar basal-body rod protein FlgG [Bacillota bacterium]|nr:flagellar basal-body rod protein FlgG [Bacillota bacterium]